MTEPNENGSLVRNAATAMRDSSTEIVIDRSKRIDDYLLVFLFGIAIDLVPIFIGSPNTEVMDEVRQVVTADGAGRIDLVEEPISSPGAGEVVVEVEASLITPGSGAYHVGRRRTDPDPDFEPEPQGYQAAGRVVELGPDVDALAIGDRVACMGTGYASHADYDVVPQNLCVPLPDDVTAEAGAFNHLAATGLHAIRRGDVRIGEEVALVGLGLVGLLTGQLAQIAGARVAGIELLDSRLDYADRLGFEHVIRGDSAPVESVRSATDGRGIDCGFLTFGGEASEAFDDLVAMMRRAPDGHQYGRIVIVGAVRLEYDFPTRLGNVDVRPSSRPGPGYHDPAWERGADYPDTVRGDIEWTTRRNIAACLRLIADGRLDVDSLITHRFPLAEAERGYEALIEDTSDALGVILEP